MKATGGVVMGFWLVGLLVIIKVKSTGSNRKGVSLLALIIVGGGCNSKNTCYH